MVMTQVQRKPAGFLCRKTSQRRLLNSTTKKGYRSVLVQGAKDAKKFLASLDKLQASFAHEHWKLYREVYPAVTSEHWYHALSCGSMDFFLQHGVQLVVAVHGSTGEAVGYISCIHVDTKKDGRPAKSHLKINHVIVSQKHRGRGVARLLFNRLIGEMQSKYPAAVGDLRIIALEFNVLALQWYWRLGFIVTGIHVGGQKLQCDGSQHPVVYLHMQRQVSLEHLPSEQGSGGAHRQLFGSEVCGAEILLAVEGAEAGSAWTSGDLRRVLSYDETTGLHKLDAGTDLNLSSKFACGLCSFRSPLHNLLQKPELQRPKRSDCADKVADDVSLVSQATHQACVSDAASTMSTHPNRRRSLKII
mmetsp:Transcript_48132/g.112557  ORF Transcript_48132/g.112557 Transcript_48132/m.112557 type:complete len:360 (+) Transcript_48132:38-1117(+)